MSETNPTNLSLFFGHLHPVLVHLPIGFLAALVLLELANRLHHLKHAAQARGVVLLATVLSAIGAVVCGLLLASAGGYDRELLFWHKWMGIALAAACVVTAITYWTRHHRAYGGALLLTLLLLGPASHFGGSMTHGKDYLTVYAPAWLRSLTGNHPQKPVVEAKKKITDPARANAFADVVQPVLAQQCVSCHSAEKLKGQLRLDTVEGIFKGGEAGPAVVAGSAKDSPLLKRIGLPLDDPKHMPPAGKPQLSDEQLAVVQWWVESGAATDKTVADLDPPVAVADAIGNLLGVASTTRPTGPAPLDGLAPQIAELESKLGVTIDRIAADQPWVDCNASHARAFGDAELAQLAPLAANISSLNLSGTGVTDAGLATVAGMPNLQRLRLERTAITDAGLRHLSRLRRLDYLNLYATGVTDAGLRALKGLPSLHHLYLWKTKVDPEAARAFAAAKADPVKIRRWQEQIAALQAMIADQKIEVYGGVSPATTRASTTAPATGPAKAPLLASTTSTAPTTGATTGPTLATTAPATAPATGPVLANGTCPVSGKPVDPARFVDFEGKRIGFCCGNCPATFQKDPAKYVAKLAAASSASPRGVDGK